MNDLFLMVLSLSVSGSVLIAVILLFRRIWGRRLSRQWQYYVWLLVVMRLLCPFSPGQTITDRLFTQMTPVEVPIVQTVPDKIAEVPLTAPTVSERTEVPEKQGWLSGVWILWCFAAVVLVVRKFTVYQGFATYMKAGQTEVSDFSLLERFGKLVEQAGVSGEVGFYTNHLVSTPLLMGVLRPRIILPSAELTESEFEYTILHELTHLKRHDILYKWLVQFTICLHWFNPLVWFLGREINRACELSCDEAVIRRLSRDQRLSYGDTLLHAAYTEPGYHSSLATVTLYESKKLLKERLDGIMNYRKQSGAITVLTVFLTLAAAFTAAAAGAYIPGRTALQEKHDLSGSKDNESGNRDLVSYTQAGYYQAPYIFELGWNVGAQTDSSHWEKASISLNDTTSLTVAFDGACLPYMQDQNAMKALGTLLNRLSTRHTITAPLVVNIIDVSGQDITELAEQFYKDNEMAGFSAIFPELELSVQKNYTEKIFRDSRIAFFASILPHLNSDLVNACVQKAYEEDNISFFAVAVSHLSEGQRQSWITRITSDDKVNFLSVLLDSTPETDDNSFTETEQEIPIYQPDNSGKVNIPISIASMSFNTEFCLGGIPDLQNAVAIRYDVKSDHPGKMGIGIRSEKSRNGGPLWFNYSASYDGAVHMRTDKNIGFEKDYNGLYRVYISSENGSLSNITGMVTVEYKK